MPKRTDLKKICIIGAGPIIIGQACEFDYSGVQACKALKEEGYEVVLVNSNPATIMTDPKMADHTYIEPLTPEILAAILRKERPDAILPTLGGQTGLNLSFQVAEMGVLDELGIEMLGANAKVIHHAEDREDFRTTVANAGVDLPKSALAHNMDEAMAALEHVGLPCIIRPAFTLGGTGGGVAYNREEYMNIAKGGIDASMVHEILVEESLLGWKELEMELMRDSAGNCVVVCSIENMDPMGVHTGDSITVAPVQTLTDREYAKLVEDSKKIVEAMELKAAGCNLQFAQDPKTGRMVAIELNPRVSRSSALASKATGFPIAKIATKVAIGYTLDEIQNDITQSTSSCFEPTIDYVVIKIPRFAFEKFPGGNETLTISMKSVGEVMAIGRTFTECLQKGFRSLEMKRFALVNKADLEKKVTFADLMPKLSTPTRDQILAIARALYEGMSVEEVFNITKMDPWFLENIKLITDKDHHLQTLEFSKLSADEMREAKRMGFSDHRLAEIFNVSETEIRHRRLDQGIDAVCKLVDTCACEHTAATPYFYSTYEGEDESRTSETPKVLILGGGPNRIGQGIEFDYCCCHAAFAVKELGYEAIMMNCNPETVSTDFDTSDRLYFEPLTVEDVLGVVRREKPVGVILQFGGQTPLNIANRLVEVGVPVLGTSVDSIDAAEDRKLFSAMLQKLNIRQTPNTTAVELEDAIVKAEKIGYPVLMRPSFVLGGAKMEIVYNDSDLRSYWAELLVYATKADVQINDERPILIDRFLQDAIEVDVDCICDGTDVYIAGIMEHIEEAGIHSGDSACSIPPQTLPADVIAELRESTRRMALELNVKGLMNVQYAVQGKTVFVLEVNPRASRTVPFVSKVTGVKIANIATKVMLGYSLKELGCVDYPEFKHVGVKEAVFPFNRFPGVDAVLGPEMKSTGEVMGIDSSFAAAFAKSQMGAGCKIPTEGTVFLSVNEDDKAHLEPIARDFASMGFKLIATRGTANLIKSWGIEVEEIKKISEGRPNVRDKMIDGSVALIINSPSSKRPTRDEVDIRAGAIRYKVPLVTTMRGAHAYTQAIAWLRQQTEIDVNSLQDYYKEYLK